MPAVGRTLARRPGGQHLSEVTGRWPPGCSRSLGQGPSRVGNPEAARSQALRLEGRAVFSIRRELRVALYVAVATLVAGVGLLVKANLERIGPVVLLGGIFAASALCYANALRARRAGRERALGEDYLLLLGALLFSAAVGFAEAHFRVLGSGWSRHLLVLAGWHLAAAYLFRSRLVLADALTASAGWLGVEARLGTVVDPLHPRFGAGPRSLLCALVFYLGSRFHLAERAEVSMGLRDVHLQFAANFAFWGALALCGDASTRWIGAVVLLGLAFVVGRAGRHGPGRTGRRHADLARAGSRAAAWRARAGWRVRGRRGEREVPRPLSRVRPVTVTGRCRRPPTCARTVGPV